MTDHKSNIVRRIKAHFKTNNNDVLMDKLQDEGLVSDLCVTLKDVADRDLVRIWGEIGSCEQ
jgi:hypothetical protein